MALKIFRIYSVEVYMSIQIIKRNGDIVDFDK